jgi:hypothetical protein
MSSADSLTFQLMPSASTIRGGGRDVGTDSDHADDDLDVGIPRFRRGIVYDET